MIARVRSFLFSIQTKLVLAMTAVIVLAILLAGVVFVARTRNDRKDQALNRIVAESPAIYNVALNAAYSQDVNTFYNTLDSLAKQQNVRILIEDARSNEVLHDTSHQADGKVLSLPPGHLDDRRGYVSWGGGETVG